MGEVEKSLTKDVEKTSQYSDVLKKNVKQSQINRLQKRAAIRAEEAIKARNLQKQIAEEALKDLKKPKINALRAKRETEYVKAKSEQKKTTTKEVKSDVDKMCDIVSELKSNTFSITPTKYENNLCMMCETEDETLGHFMICNYYQSITVGSEWKI